jgi:hypothetical protein
MWRSLAEARIAFLPNSPGRYTPKINMLFTQSVYALTIFLLGPIAKAALLRTKYQICGIALPHGPKHNRDERICARRRRRKFAASQEM